MKLLRKASTPHTIAAVSVHVVPEGSHRSAVPQSLGKVWGRAEVLEHRGCKLWLRDPAALVSQSGVQAGVNLQWLWYSRWGWRKGRFWGESLLLGQPAPVCARRTQLCLGSPQVSCRSASLLHHCSLAKPR